MAKNGEKGENGAVSPSAASAALALAITQPEWSQLGVGDGQNVTVATSFDETVERLTSLMLIRIAAWIQLPQTYKDLSTTTICQQIVSDSDLWPKGLTQQVMDEMKLYVETILKSYQKVPYHNFEHCYHVSVSVNKIIDMIIEPLSSYVPESTEEIPPDTFGFKDDPLMLLAMVFAALVHDVEHKGIPNRQLANEDDELAILYNDTAIAEQHSLCFAFSEMLNPTYGKLRECLFPEKEDYRRFRKAVVNLVLCTDIADPERSQLTKSKWKEAFGDPYETVERKVRKAMKAERKGSLSRATRVNRRMSTQSLISDLSFEAPVIGGSEAHMLSDDSSVSLSPDESSDDEPLEYRKPQKANPPSLLPLSNQQPKLVPSKAAKFQVYEVPLSTKSGPPTKTKTQRFANADSAQQSNLSPVKNKSGRRQRRSIAESSVSTNSTGDRVTAGMTKKFHRRLSKEGDDSKKRNTRLGLMRTVDLTGEQIQHFNGMRRASAAPGTHREVQSDSVKNSKGLSAEETNELRKTVLMETILLACDVAHNLQGWDQMAKWSNRLYMELRKAFIHGRGADPTDGWYNNQIGFLEAYLLPLARRLDDTGVFGETRGGIFAEIVHDNRDCWSREGMSLTANIIKTGNEVFPEDESETAASWSC